MVVATRPTTTTTVMEAMRQMHSSLLMPALEQGTELELELELREALAMGQPQARWQ